MTNQILGGVLIAVVSGLVAFFLTHSSATKKTETVVKEKIETHVSTYHQNTLTNKQVSEMIEKEMKEHINICNGNNRLDKIEKALIWIVLKMNGNPREMGF